MINSLEESLVSKEYKEENFEENDSESLHKEFSLNDAIKAAGDYGKYHKINLIFLSIVWIMIPCIPIMLPYFRMLPEYVCKDHNGERICSPKEICNKSIHNFQVKNSSNIKTWASDFNIICEEHFYFGLLGSFYFIGILFGNLFIAKLTDNYGRKPVLISYLILYITITILAILSKNFYIFFFVMFMIGVIYSGTSLCAFVINYESSSKDKKCTFSTILSMSYGVGAIIQIIIFYLFHNWIITVSISCIGITIVLMYTFYLQESPEFLFIKGRNKEMIEVLRYIANINDRSESLEKYLRRTNIYHNISQSSKEKDAPLGLLEVINYEEYRINLLIMCLNWFIMTMVFYGINFNVSNFGTNAYVTGILVYFSEVLAQGTSLYFILNFGFKTTLCGSYFISAISLISIRLFISDLNKFGFFLIFIAKFGISAVNVCNYIYTAELFPTVIRVAALSLCSLISRIGGLSGTMLIEITDYAMIIFGILSLITILFITKIEQK